MNLVKNFERSLDWISKNTIQGEGIVINSRERISYPEVTGYFIPTLLKWGEFERAKSYGDWLLSIQTEEGGWVAAGTNVLFMFDSGQILKGLYELSDVDEKYKTALIKGCEWWVSKIDFDGKPLANDYELWGEAVPHSVLLYCLEPILKTAKKYNLKYLEEKVLLTIGWFKNNHKNLISFTHLSHFHAYVVEALIDLGEKELAVKALKEVESVQADNGKIPAYKNVSWVCSTGMLQYSLCYYKLGELEKGNRVFEYAAKLQNRSGGWYGGYGFRASYFPWKEISWAVKYFLDAFHLKLKLEFESMAHIFSDEISKVDGRYALLKNIIPNDSSRVLDAGCGKGRYLRNFLNEGYNNLFFATDISMNVMRELPEIIDKKQCGLLNIDHQENFFDYVYCIEALEHSVHLKRAVSELCRVVKPSGTVVIIDKNKKALGRLKLPAWEQWFDSKSLSKLIESNGFKVRVIENLAFEGSRPNDNLFTAWVCEKNR